VATEAAWLNWNDWEKRRIKDEEPNNKKREKMKE